jgi:flagellar basal-body rod protein FlgF
MQTGLYVSLAGAIAMARRLDTVAANVANAATAGYRAEEVTFESIMTENVRGSVLFPTPGDTYISQRTGGITHTGNSLDVAIQGQGYIAIANGDGTAYTRDGRLTIAPTGELQTVTGQAVLDVGATPIQIDPAGGPVEIARDGMITQGGRQLGAIGLFAMPAAATLTRVEGAAITPDLDPEPIVDFTANGLRQGYIEQANVEPVAEMTRMIALQRTFNALWVSMEDTEGVMRQAIRQLGPG